MTFVPHQGPSAGGLSPRVRMILFWALMIVLALVFWQTSLKKTAPAARTMSYSDFMAQVDKANVSQAHLYESPTATEVQGQLREPAGEFHTTIPKETIPDLTERLRKQGAAVQISEQQKSPEWAVLLVKWGPLVLILAIWIFLVNRRTRRAQASPPTNAANRPIG